MATEHQTSGRRGALEGVRGFRLFIAPLHTSLEVAPLDDWGRKSHADPHSVRGRGPRGGVGGWTGEVEE